MSRRPISNQGKAKPDVKSYPTRPHTTTTRPKKPVEPAKPQEDELTRMNEELEKEFPDLSKQFNSFMDPTNPATLQGFLQDIGSKFGVNTPIPDFGAFNPPTHEQAPPDNVIPDIDKLFQSFNNVNQTSDALHMADAHQDEYTRMNDELNAKNAAVMQECKAMLMKLGQDTDLGQDSQTPPQSEEIPVDFESIKSREEEYVRLNEELEKKKAIFTKQAEHLLGKQQRKDAVQVPKHSDKKPPQTRSINKPVKSQQSKADTQPKPLLQDSMQGEIESVDALRAEILSGTDFADTIRRIEAKVMQINNTEQVEESKQQAPPPSPPQQEGAQSGQVKEIVNISSTRPCTAPAPVPRTPGAHRMKDPIRDIEPPEEVGAEAIQRFLKAKLNVLQEELDRGSEEIAQKDAELQECKKELIAKQEQTVLLDRQATSLRSVSEKQQKKLDLVTNELDNSKLEIAGLKRDLDTYVRNQKKTDSTQSAVEVRLNRALEEIEKQKSTIQRLKGDSKDTQQSSSKRLEELQSENKTLFKQRDELMIGFKKQMRLIDNLKRQKMHIEAAKMLAFSEEEFMRVLDWWKVKD